MQVLVVVEALMLAFRIHAELNGYSRVEFVIVYLHLPYRLDDQLNIPWGVLQLVP